MSRHQHTSRALFLGALFLTAAPGSVALAQEGPPPLPIQGHGTSDPREEMMKLFRKVELRLREIDDHLFDASAGEAPVADEQESGIGDLIQTSISKSEANLEDIDRILQIAEEQGGT